MSNSSMGMRKFSYKEPEVLREYLYPSGKIKPRRVTGLAPVEQYRMVGAVERARQLAILPYPE